MRPPLSSLARPLFRGRVVEHGQALPPRRSLQSWLATAPLTTTARTGDKGTPFREAQIAGKKYHEKASSSTRLNSCFYWESNVYWGCQSMSFTASLPKCASVLRVPAMIFEARRWPLVLVNLVHRHVASHTSQGCCRVAVQPFAALGCGVGLQETRAHGPGYRLC